MNGFPVFGRSRDAPDAKHIIGKCQRLRNENMSKVWGKETIYCKVCIRENSKNWCDNNKFFGRNMTCQILEKTLDVQNVEQFLMIGSEYGANKLFVQYVKENKCLGLMLLR